MIAELPLTVTAASRPEPVSWQLGRWVAQQVGEGAVHLDERHGRPGEVEHGAAERAALEGKAEALLRFGQLRLAGSVRGDVSQGAPKPNHVVVLVRDGSEAQGGRDRGSVRAAELDVELAGVRPREQAAHELAPVCRVDPEGLNRVDAGQQVMGVVVVEHLGQRVVGDHDRAVQPRLVDAVRHRVEELAVPRPLCGQLGAQPVHRACCPRHRYEGHPRGDERHDPGGRPLGDKSRRDQGLLHGGAPDRHQDGQRHDPTDEHPAGRVRERPRQPGLVVGASHGEPRTREDQDHARLERKPEPAADHQELVDAEHVTHQPEEPGRQGGHDEDVATAHVAPRHQEGQAEAQDRYGRLRRRAPGSEQPDGPRIVVHQLVDPQ